MSKTRIELFQNNSIWSEPRFLPPVVPHPIKIAIEGFPCQKLFQILDTINRTGYRVFNNDRKWLNIFNRNPENNLFPYLLNQMIQNSQASSYVHPSTKDPIKDLGFQFYYNLHGLMNVWIDWLKDQKIIPGGQENLLQGCSSHLIDPPDYIIYLFSTPEIMKMSDCPYSDPQLDQIYSQYEWILENSHCPHPLFKVNLKDSPECIVETIIKIMKQICERVELEIHT